MCPFFCLCLVYIPVGAVLRLASRCIHSPAWEETRKIDAIESAKLCPLFCVIHTNHYMFVNCPTKSREHNQARKDENREALGTWKHAHFARVFLRAKWIYDSLITVFSRPLLRKKHQAGLLICNGQARFRWLVHVTNYCMEANINHIT